MEPDRLVRVASVSDPAAARICAAMLESAGIPARVHGEGLGPYAFTVGEMAITDIWVPESLVGDAREMLAGADLDDAWVDTTPPVATTGGLPVRIIAAALAVIVGGVVIRLLMRVF